MENRIANIIRWHYEEGQRQKYYLSLANTFYNNGLKMTAEVLLIISYCVQITNEGMKGSEKK